MASSASAAHHLGKQRPASSSVPLANFGKAVPPHRWRDPAHSQLRAPRSPFKLHRVTQCVGHMLAICRKQETQKATSCLSWRARSCATTLDSLSTLSRQQAPRSYTLLPTLCCSWDSLCCCSLHGVREALRDADTPASPARYHLQVPLVTSTNSGAAGGGANHQNNPCQHVHPSTLPKTP